MKLENLLSMVLVGVVVGVLVSYLTRNVKAAADETGKFVPGGSGRSGGGVTGSW
jgi:hypothetical protein